MRRCAVLLVLLLTACTSTAPPRPADPALAVNVDAAEAAMQTGNAAEAAREYLAALQRARADDNAAAIATAGTNRVIAELADNQVAASLAHARDLKAELARRHAAAPPALDLVIATALYRQGRLAEADAVARGMAAGSDQTVALRGQFLMGLIAAERHDTAGLRAAALAFAGRKDPVSVADTTELGARLALARGDAATAEGEAREAVKLRASLHDDRGIARCLALAAGAAQTTGARAEAADLYLRAGRDAAIGGDKVLAREWLGRAKALATDPRVRTDATEVLATLGA